MKYYYIYLTTNLISGKQYIGQHYGELDDSYLGSGTYCKNAIKKYGKQNFKKEILEICENYDELNKAEQKWIEKFNAVKDSHFYNIASGGSNSNPLAGLTEEQRKQRSKKLSEYVKGEKNYFYNKHYKKEQHPMWNHHYSEESKKKMSLAKQGNKAPTAKSVAIYDLEGNFLQSFQTQKDLKIFLGLSPNGSTDTLKKYIREQKPYHGYIVKYLI